MCFSFGVLHMYVDSYSAQSAVATPQQEARFWMWSAVLLENVVHAGLIFKLVLKDSLKTWTNHLSEPICTCTVHCVVLTPFLSKMLNI